MVLTVLLVKYFYTNLQQNDIEDENDEDMIEIIMSLGYNREGAIKALKDLDKRVRDFSSKLDK